MDSGMGGYGDRLVAVLSAATDLLADLPARVSRLTGPDLDVVLPVIDRLAALAGERAQRWLRAQFEDLAEEWERHDHRPLNSDRSAEGWTRTRVGCPRGDAGGDRALRREVVDTSPPAAVTHSLVAQQN